MPKINGIDLDEVEFLSVQIKNKFGSMHEFAAEAEIAYRPILKFFNDLEVTQERFEYYTNVYKKTKSSREFQYGRILPEHREAIRKVIQDEYKKYSNFCRKYKHFDVVYISNIVEGRLKLVTKKYVKLVRILEKRYGLKIR
jgi:hypothetical protein